MRPLITKQMIDKAKKKLKKLQKRQRKQDKQGVSNTADQWPSDDVKTYAEAAKLNINKINPTILDIVDAASKATIERIDTSNRPIVYDVALNPEIIKLPNVTIRPLRDGDRVKVKLGGCDEWFKGTVIRARKQEVELDPHEYTYPKIADETNIIDIRII
jgi:sRNA-binding protein